MCVEIEFEGKLLSSFGDLMGALGGDPPMHEGYPSPYPEDSCLCGVDWAKLERKFNVTVTEGDFIYLRMDRNT